MTTENEEPTKRGRKSRIAEMAAALELVEPGDDKDTIFESVREQARWDPVMGAPMGFFKDGEDEPTWIEPGQWFNYDEFVDPETELPVNMPVQALGVSDDGLAYYYFNTLGHVVKLKGDAGKGMFELLFAGRNNYLFWLYPRVSKEGFVVGWEADQLKQALTRWAGWCGTFDDEDGVRGRGMWRDDHGKAVFHAGDAVLIDGKWCKPGRYGGYIYPARKFTGRPKRHRDIPDPGKRALAIYQTWAWERPRLDPILQLGWIMTAKMGGALYRRPFIWVTGPAGSGKSYLQAFNRSMMHGALLASSNTTSAAIYQKLGKDSIPVLVDEQESKADTTLTDKLLDLIRAAYSGDSLDRGDKDGKAKSYTLRSSFMASSIAKPPMESSDESRMALLSLRKPDALPTSGAYTEGEAYRIGQALTMRAIKWFPQWEALLAGVDAALRARPGHQSRSLDTFAPLIAGYHMAVHDTMPTEAQYAEYAALVDPDSLTELQNRMEDWEKCMRHLFGAVPDSLKHLSRKTIGQILGGYMRSTAAGADDETDIDKALAGFKLCVTWKKKDERGFPVPQDRRHALLFIPNIDPMLTQLFTGTGWAGRMGNAGPWNGVLKQAPRHLWIGDFTCSKGGFGSSKGVAFKLYDLWKHLTGEEDDAEAAPGPMFDTVPVAELDGLSPFDDPEDF